MRTIKPKVVKKVFNGSQTIYRFENGYGASVINHKLSRGLELAVIKFTGKRIDKFTINYNSPITDNVLTWLDEDELQPILNQIKNLGV